MCASVRQEDEGFREEYEARIALIGCFEALRISVNISKRKR